METTGSPPRPFALWNPGVYHRFGENDKVPRPLPPEPLKAVVCRNETAHFQLAVAASESDAALHVVPSELTDEACCIGHDEWTVRFVDFTGTKAHGRVSDILSTEPVRLLEPGHIQPVWLSLNAPKDAAPGTYRGEVRVQFGDAAAVVPVELEVLPAALPDPREDAFHLDLWQHPGAVARYHRVEPWSEPHWALLREYTRFLAQAGQNPITACIIHDPWASQTLDPHLSMVEWIRHKDGRLEFDFTVFDRYVELCLEEGLTGPINCYAPAMGPGDRMDCPIRYWDLSQQRHGTLDCTVGDDVYVDAWRQFFEAFLPHLEASGWRDNTCIAIDEAREEKMQAMLHVVPDSMKVALAGWYHEALRERVHDYCIFYPGPAPEVIEARLALGKITTFYTCCAPEFPNTFSFSPPVESRILPWHALAIGADGYLRWALASWPEDPLNESDFGPWPAGDTFLIYPGPRSSVRFELLKAGIADFGAWRLARELANGDERLDRALALANENHDGREFDPMKLDEARELVNSVLRETAR